MVAALSIATEMGLAIYIVCSFRNLPEETLHAMQVSKTFTQQTYSLAPRPALRRPSMSSQDTIQGARPVFMSAATIDSGTYIFYFSLVSNKLRFCLDDGSADTAIKIEDVAITASNNNTRLAAAPYSGTNVCGTCNPMQHDSLETNFLLYSSVCSTRITSRTFPSSSGGQKQAADLPG